MQSPVSPKRILLAVVLTGAVLLGCSLFSPPQTPTQQAPQIRPLVTHGAPGLPAPVLTPQPESGDAQADALLPFAQSDLEKLSQIPRYQIDLAVDFAAHSFTGHATVSYTNTEADRLDRLYFRLLPNGRASYGNGSLLVSRVGLNKQAASFSLLLSDTVLEIPLPDNLAPGQEAQIDFDFEGIVPLDFGGEETPSGYGIYNVSDGVMALSGWYPILAVYDQQGWNLDPISAIGDSVYSDMAFYTVHLAVDSSLVVAATGIESSRHISGDQTEQSYATGPVRDFYVMLSPDFHVVSQVVDGTRLNAYTLPGQDAAGEAALAVASQSLAIYNQRFGAYPYRELDVVEGPMRNALGVEYPTIVMIASQLYDDIEQPSFSTAIAHEVAHQWWYNLVGNDVFDEPWLDEALTSFSSSLYYEDKYGQPGYQSMVDYWQERYDNLVKEGADDLVTGSLDHFEHDADPRSYGGVVYTKGALFFNALRKEIGDQAFFAALRAYFRDYEYQVAHGQDLLDEFEHAAGRPLQDFYHTWLYSAQ